MRQVTYWACIAGCFIAFLIGTARISPVIYHLKLERFRANRTKLAVQQVDRMFPVVIVTTDDQGREIAGIADAVYQEELMRMMPEFYSYSVPRASEHRLRERIAHREFGGIPRMLVANRGDFVVLESVPRGTQYLRCEMLWHGGDNHEVAWYITDGRHVYPKYRASFYEHKESASSVLAGLAVNAVVWSCAGLGLTRKLCRRT